MPKIIEERGMMLYNDLETTNFKLTVASIIVFTLQNKIIKMSFVKKEKNWM